MWTSLTSREWIEHYDDNAVNQLPIPWEAGAELSAAEARSIIVSLQAWQLGETGEGRHLLLAARRYANVAQDPDFLEAMRLFIVEEQRHGELLGRFLDLHGAARIQRDWGDSVFRQLRYGMRSLEVWTTVVITVETLALIYYRALMLATQSRVLQAICRQILKDEVHHLQFQYEHLAEMYQRRGTFARHMTLWSHRVLFLGTMLAVWIAHHRALRAGGYPFRRYWRSSWNRMAFHWRQMGLTTRSSHRKHEELTYLVR